METGVESQVITRWSPTPVFYFIYYATIFTTLTLTKHSTSAPGCCILRPVRKNLGNKQDDRDEKRSSGRGVFFADSIRILVNLALETSRVATQVPSLSCVSFFTGGVG